MTGRNATAPGALLSLVWIGWPANADARDRHQPAAQEHGRHHAAEPHRRRAAAATHRGRAQQGKASIYADSLRGRRMADGTPFNPASNAAASKTLPLGTTARVTNVENGRTTVVQVRDRGLHRAGRIIDVSPGSADALGMTRDGVAPVAVAPLPDTVNEACRARELGTKQAQLACQSGASPFGRSAPRARGPR